MKPSTSAILVLASFSSLISPRFVSVVLVRLVFFSFWSIFSRDPSVAWFPSIPRDQLLNTNRVRLSFFFGVIQPNYPHPFSRGKIREPPKKHTRQPSDFLLFTSTLACSLTFVRRCEVCLP